MPVRSLNSAVLKWPARSEVLTAARRWASELRGRDPNVVGVWCIGSAARGDYGVGSDIDLVVVVHEVPADMVARQRMYEPSGLPVPEDLWVYTPAEWSDLARHSPQLWRRLQAEALDLLAPAG